MYGLLYKNGVHNDLYLILLKFPFTTKSTKTEVLPVLDGSRSHRVGAVIGQGIHMDHQMYPLVMSTVCY